jgi:hypothetical protein
LCHWLGSVSILTIWSLTMLHVSIPILSPSSFIPPLYHTYQPSLESDNPHQQISIFVKTWNAHLAQIIYILKECTAFKVNTPNQGLLAIPPFAGYMYFKINTAGCTSKERYIILL